MSKIEIVKEMIIKMDGIAEVKMDFINKGFTGIRLDSHGDRFCLNLQIKEKKNRTY